MASPKWATVEDVQDAWLGEPLDVPTKTVQAWLARAERRLAREIPRLQERIDSGKEPDLPELVTDVLAEMVETKLRNPEGYRQIQDTTGPMSGSATFGGDNPGGLVVTDDMRRRLSPPGTAGAAFEIDLLPDDPLRSPLEGALINGPDWMLPGRDGAL